MSATQLSPSAKQRFYDANNVPLVGGKLYTYVAGSSTPVATYQDSTLGAANTNPIVLDSRGECSVWLVPGSFYKMALYDSVGGAIWTVDQVSLDNGILAALTAYEAALAAPTGSSLVGNILPGAGAVGATVAAAIAAIEVNALGYGADITGSTDSTAAVQRAITALPASGGTVKIQGLTVCYGQLVLGSKTVIFRGDGRMATTLKYTGNSLFITQTISTGDVGFVDITISGAGVTTGPIAVVGSVCYQSGNNAYSKDAQFIFWDTISTWQSGFYHKHWNTYFNYFKNGFYGYSQNNLNFFGCRFSTFETGVLVASGIGPLLVSGGSIENIGKFFCSPILGAIPNVVFDGVYVESGSVTPIPSGITCTNGVQYFNAWGLVSAQSQPIVIRDCAIYTAGCLNMVYFNSGTSSAIYSTGNQFYNDPAGNSVGAIYANGGGGQMRGVLQDTFNGNLPAGGVYASGGFGSSYVGLTMWDPVLLNWQRYSYGTNFTNATMANGWVSNTGPVGYVVGGDGKVTLRGQTTGTSATLPTIFTLPAALAPSVGKFFPVEYGSDLIGVVRVFATGAVYWDTALGSAANVNLDGISFYPGS